MTLLLMLFVFVLAIFAGNELISKVPPTLHTPLMSGANAISGITIVGALMCAQFGVESASAGETAIASEAISIGEAENDDVEGNVSKSAAIILGICAIIFATINVIGGFMVTDRMLGMFTSKKKK